MSFSQPYRPLFVGTFQIHHFIAGANQHVLETDNTRGVGGKSCVDKENNRRHKCGSARHAGSLPQRGGRHQSSRSARKACIRPAPRSRTWNTISPGASLAVRGMAALLPKYPNFPNICACPLCFPSQARRRATLWPYAFLRCLRIVVLPSFAISPFRAFAMDFPRRSHDGRVERISAAESERPGFPRFQT